MSDYCPHSLRVDEDGERLLPSGCSLCAGIRVKRAKPVEERDVETAIQRAHRVLGEKRARQLATKWGDDNDE